MKTKNLKYNITISTAPTMPKLGKGTECVQLLLSQVSKDMHEPLVPMLFPILGAQVSEAKFQYPDLSWKELCGMMANLVADSGCNKGQLSNIVEAICHNFREHDEKELDKLVEWQRQMVIDKEISCDDLYEGQMLKLSWLPDRTCIIRYQGNGSFKVVSSENTRLAKDDTFECRHFINHEPAYLHGWKHGDREPVTYAIGKKNGIIVEHYLED